MRKWTAEQKAAHAREQKLLDDMIFTIGTDSKINTVKIIATSINVHEEGLEYYPTYITIAWYDPVDEHNWQITQYKADRHNEAHAYGMALIPTSLTFDRPNDYSPPDTGGGCLTGTDCALMIAGLSSLDSYDSTTLTNSFII